MFNKKRTNKSGMIHNPQSNFINHKLQKLHTCELLVDTTEMAQVFNLRSNIQIVEQIESYYKHNIITTPASTI